MCRWFSYTYGQWRNDLFLVTGCGTVSYDRRFRHRESDYYNYLHRNRYNFRLFRNSYVNGNDWPEPNCNGYFTNDLRRKLCYINREWCNNLYLVAGRRIVFHFRSNGYSESDNHNYLYGYGNNFRLYRDSNIDCNGNTTSGCYG